MEIATQTSERSTPSRSPTSTSERSTPSRPPTSTSERSTPSRPPTSTSKRSTPSRTPSSTKTFKISERRFYYPRNCSTCGLLQLDGGSSASSICTTPGCRSKLVVPYLDRLKSSPPSPWLKPSDSHRNCCWLIQWPEEEFKESPKDVNDDVSFFNPTVPYLFAMKTTEELLSERRRAEERARQSYFDSDYDYDQEDYEAREEAPEMYWLNASARRRVRRAVRKDAAWRARRSADDASQKTWSSRRTYDLAQRRAAGAPRRRGLLRRLLDCLAACWGGRTSTPTRSTSTASRRSESF